MAPMLKRPAASVKEVRLLKRPAAKSLIAAEGEEGVVNPLVEAPSVDRCHVFPDGYSDSDAKAQLGPFGLVKNPVRSRWNSNLCKLWRVSSALKSQPSPLSPGHEVDAETSRSLSQVATTLCPCVETCSSSIS